MTAKTKPSAKEIREAAEELAQAAESVIHWGKQGYFVEQNDLRAAVEHYRSLVPAQ